MSNVRRLSRKIRVDVSTDGTNWLNLPGRFDNAPNFTPDKVDATDVDTDGYKSKEITLQDGVIVVQYNSLSSSGTPNPAQELVEACVAQFGDAARLYVQWYDTDGGSRGYRSLAIVTVNYTPTGVGDLRKVTATFDTDGTITKLSQSAINTLVAALSASAPVITSVTPSGKGAGGAVRILGQGFLGVTGPTHVTFGGTNATSYDVASDNEIVAVLPAGSAGAAAVVVTNATGASNSYSYTRT